MDKRPDELGRDPLERTDPLDEFRQEPNPLTGEPGSPLGTTPDPALADTGVAGQPEVDEVEVTRIEIERTRADMSETVDAIQNKLSPQNLKEQAKDRVKEATVGKAQEAGSGVVNTIRQNPLPAALTGIGLGWLFMNARNQSTSQRRYQSETYAYPLTHDYPPVREYPPVYDERATEGSSTGQALGDAKDKVGETVGQAQDRAGQAASQARERASRLSDQARYQAQRAKDGSQRMLQENPLAVGALAVGVGAAIGLAIPETSKEHEVMGEARDNLVEKAQEKAQETQQKVQRVAEEAQGAAQQEADNQGLTNQ